MSLAGQLDLLEYARTRRDAGMSLAAEAEGPDFAAAAYYVICAIAARQPTVHIDDVLAGCALRPHHPNAWGAVWMRAIRNGVIIHSGTVRPCRTDGKKHAHQYPIYSSLIQGREG